MTGAVQLEPSSDRAGGNLAIEIVRPVRPTHGGGGKWVVGLSQQSAPLLSFFFSFFNSAGRQQLTSRPKKSTMARNKILERRERAQRRKMMREFSVGRKNELEPF